MNKMTSMDEMQKFRFGCKVWCCDGEEGILNNISFATSTRHLNAIGVRLGHFFGKIVYLPFAAVKAANSEGITLTMTYAELSLASQQPSTGILFDNRSVVRNTVTKAQGTLELVAVYPESAELAYVVTHNLRPGQRTLLRSAFLARLETRLITISTSEAQLHTFPMYRSDQELQQDLEKRLFELALLHVDAHGIHIHVLDGVLYLEGNVSSALRGEMVADQSVGVIGLLEVKNHLIGDDQLANDLAFALGHDPRTHNLPIGVYPRLGIIRLSGAVHNIQQKATAEEITQVFPGVRSVINDLVVDPKATLLNVMASAAGGEAEDSVPGNYIRHTK